MPYKERKHWRAKVTYQKKQYTKKCKTKAEAKEWEREKLKELKSLRTQTHTDSLLSVSTKYLNYCERQFSRTTFIGKKKALKELMSIIGNISVYEVNSEMILHKVLMPQKTPSLFNSRRKDLSAFFEYAKDFHGIKYNPVTPIKKIPRERVNQPMPTHGELAKILLSLKAGQDKNMIIFYSECGARKEEGLRLTWSDDIDFTNRIIRLGNRKNKTRELRYRYVPMSDKAYAVLQDQFKKRISDNDYVWQNRAVWEDKDGRVLKHPNYGQRFTARRKFMKGVCKSAEVKGFGFHGLRRYYASNLVAEGFDLETIRQRLGHSTVSVTDRYILRIKDDFNNQKAHRQGT